MPEFFQPAWLWVALTIVVPVLIHLWNVREGKTLKVGSVVLLRQIERQRASSFRIREWLLLALRCLLILLLVMLLAGPYRLSEPKLSKQTGWVVLERRYRKELYARFGRQIDSLAAAGFGLHYFERDFPPAKPEEWAVQHTDSTATDTLSYWTTLQQLHRRVPAGLPVFLYTGNRLNRFTGRRPLLAMNLHWQVVTPADSVLTWLAAAYLSSPDSIRVVKATSKPASLSYAIENIPAAGAPHKGYITSFEKGNLLLLQTNKQLQVDTSTLRVAVFAQGYPNDAVYLQAAIRAVQQFTRRRIELQRIPDGGTIKSAPDWLFWLSDKPVPFIDHCNIFRYVAGREQAYHSWIVQNNRESTGEPVALYKRVSDSSADPDDVVLWQDGYGQPVLTKSKARGSAFFNFYSRFHPQWTDLPWSSRFPVWLLPLLLDKERMAEKVQDTRALDKVQIMAAVVPAGRKGPAAAPPEETDLRKGIWVAAFLVFFLERALSYKRKNKSA